jgi:DNA-binding transcriptional ArsR family regulator
VSQAAAIVGVMEARIVSFPNGRESSVRVEPDRIVVERLALADPGLATWLAAQPMDDHAILVERALRIGLTALQSVGVTLNVDAVRSEFERFADQSRVANEKAAEALEQVLRTNFSDGEGRLPRTLEAFLGDRGKLRSMVEELFDPTRRDSAVGRISGMLDNYFDGDASKLATLLDPTRMGSPLHQFRLEVAAGFQALQEKLVAIEAAQNARAGERARSAAKGADFEDLLEELLGEIARGGNDLLERTGSDAGDAGRSKKGDFVLTLDPDLARGVDLRIVIEAKDRRVSGREMREELRAAKTNRDACIGLVVFTLQHAPAGIAPFDVRAGDVYVVLDPANPDPATLHAAVRLARLLALASLRESEAEIDVAGIQESLTAIREALEIVRALKVQLTSIGTSSATVSAGLDRLREAIMAHIRRAELELSSPA